MNTLAISQLSTLRWSFEEDAQAYTARGFGGNRYLPTEAGRLWTRPDDRVARRIIAVGNFLVVGRWIYR